MAPKILRLVDRQAPNIVRGLFYIILICIIVLAIDVVLLQYSKSTREYELFRYNTGLAGRSKSKYDPDADKRSRMRPMRHKINPHGRIPLPSVSVPISRDYYSSSNMTCRKGFSRSNLQKLYNEKFDPTIPLFVDTDFIDRPSAVRYPLPFGFRDAESSLLNVLRHMPKYDIPDNVPGKSCLRCVVQGNGGNILRTRLGNVINNFDVVFRLNAAPIQTYERDIGNKTTFRMAYPEGAFRRPEQYDLGWTFVVMIFKPLDITWLETIIRGRQMNSGSGFWKKIPLAVPKPTHEFRIFNPEILLETATLMGFDLKDGKVDKNIPTSGMLAIMMALRLCDEVAVAGFGYDPNRPSGPLHYYDSLPMREIWKSWTHDIHHERGILRLMKQQGVITDLTGGIR